MKGLQRQKYVIGNWKMNGCRSKNAELLKGLQLLHQQNVSGENEGHPTLIACPPSVYIQQVSAILNQGASNIQVGAQNVSDYSDGAYTGEVSTTMLKDIDCHYVLVGHSERRTLFLENSVAVSKKVSASLNAGLVPILCVGETLEQFITGACREVIRKQILSAIPAEDVGLFANVIIAYEPVWAIGTGKVATPEYAQEIHQYIREVLAEFDLSIAEGMSILYGGSVNADNAENLFAQPDIDGALVGGASLDAAQFLGIADALATTGEALAS